MNQDKPETPAEEKPQGKSGKRRHKTPWYKRPPLAGLAILALIIVVIAVVLIWQHSRHYEYTDDAFIDATPELVSPQVAGRIVRVLVDDNQDVAAGQLLVEIDPASFNLQVREAQAEVAQAEAQLAEARAHQRAGEAQLDQAKANLDSERAETALTLADLRRYRSLQQANAGAVSRQQLDHASSASTAAEAQLRASEKAVSAALAQLAYYDSETEAAVAAARSAETRVDEAQLSLDRTHVRARLPGRIAQKTVAVGNYAQPGADLMAIVPRDVYITANFKEVQLNRLRKGQPVKVKIDSFPDWKLTGRVDSVQPGTGQVFSAIPAENATGNWVKVVQRVPVKILLDSIPDDPNRLLAPGMSVETTVTVR